LTSEGPDKPYYAYSWIWVREKVLRSVVDQHLRKSTSPQFKYEFEGQTSFIGLYGARGEEEATVAGLAGTFEELIRLLSDLPDFRSLGEKGVVAAI